MALNFYAKTITKSAIAATAATESIDLAGFSKVAIHTIFATCSGTTNTQVDFKVQTSNDDSDWVDLVTIVDEAGNDVVDLSGDSYMNFIPEQTVAGDSGIGRYIRFYLTASGTFSASYSVKVLARQ